MQGAKCDVDGRREQGGVRDADGIQFGMGVPEGARCEMWERRREARSGV